MSRTLGILGATTLTLALLAPTAAYANHWGSTDQRRDVDGFNYDPEPEPCGTITELDSSAEGNEDITRLGVQHTRRAVIITTRFRDLGEDREQILTVSIRSSTGGYELDLERSDPSTGDWSVFTFLSTEPDYPDPEDIPECGSFGIISDGIGCRIGRDVDFAHDLIRLKMPRKCIGNPRWVRVGVEADRFVDNDGSTFDIYSDEWDNGGKKLSYWLPPFGPRVRATAGATIGHTGTKRVSDATRSHVVVRDGREITRR